MNAIEASSARSPCIGYCQLNEASICLGCYRNISEIAAWAETNENEQKIILMQAAARKKQGEEEII